MSNNKTMSSFLQDKNIKAFQKLLETGFSPPQARRALLAACKINVQELAKTATITAPTIYSACYGIRYNQEARQILSDVLGIPLHVLFPDCPK